MRETSKVWKDVAGAEATKQALIAAGLQLFGDKGYDATSTRELASAAKSNVGSIAYHFGGKPGLHRACGEAIAEIMRNAAGPALSATVDTKILTSEAARSLFPALLSRVAQFLLTSREADRIVPFIMREMAHPGEAFEAIYASMLHPVHERLCAVWEAATGESAESETTKLTVFSMIGQLIYFRIGRPAITRRLGMVEYGDAGVKAIVEVLVQNVSARLNMKERES